MASYEEILGYFLGAKNGGGGDAHGIPSGGFEGEVLFKKSNTNYDAEWRTPQHIYTGYLQTTENDVTYITPDFDEDIVYLAENGYCIRLYDLGNNGTIMYMIAAFSHEDNGDWEDWAWFLDVSDPGAFPKIRMFKKVYDEDVGDDVYAEQTPPTHAVTGAWVGTAAQYAALSPNYDSNTIYYIKE